MLGAIIAWIKHRATTWKNHKTLLLWVLLFLLHLLSLGYSPWNAIAAEELRIKIAYVVIALSFMFVPKIEKNAVYKTFYFFILAIIVVGIGTLINFFHHYHYYVASVKHSRSIPIITGVHHMYYSVAVAWAAFLCLFLWQKERKKHWLVTFGFLVLLLLFLTSRTGLFAFACGVATWIFHYLWIQKRRYWIALALILIGIASSVIAVATIEPLKRRYENTLLDIQMFLNKEDLSDWSISRRLVSYHAAWKTLNEHPWGVGIGAVDSVYKNYFFSLGYRIRRSSFTLPHNQFLEFGILIGWMGIAVFLLLWILPFVETKAFGQHWLWSVFCAVAIGALLFESMLERQRGIAIVVLFYCLLYRSLKEKSLV